MRSDTELLDRWCEGDAAAGNELFERHFRSVYRFFDKKVPGEAEELVQETFLACVKSRESFRRESSFRTYLFATARHMLFRHWRDRVRHGDKLDFTDVSLADLDTSTGTRLVRAEERDRLLWALRQLPLEQQLLLELTYWEELGADELAEVFEIAPPTTRSRLHRARQALKKVMEANSAAPAPDLEVASVSDLQAWAASMRGAS